MAAVAPDPLSEPLAISAAQLRVDRAGGTRLERAAAATARRWRRRAGGSPTAPSEQYLRELVRSSEPPA